jgi:hypothetical protein
METFKSLREPLKTVSGYEWALRNKGLRVSASKNIELLEIPLKY